MSPGSVAFLKRLKTYAADICGTNEGKAHMAAMNLVENGCFKTVTDAVAFVARHQKMGLTQFDMIADAYWAFEESRKSPVPDMPDAA